MGKPIVKWVGGKSRLLGELLARCPEEMGTYAEPFAGGAAFFFALSEQSRKGQRKFAKALLSDQNEELVACYRAVKTDVEGVIEALRPYHYDRDLYYATRARETKGMTDVERAARLIFLNRTCFNGLWRVNSKGQFNVPFGRYDNPRILDEDGLRRASRALKKASIKKADFSKLTAKLKAGDFVYLDPPYVPVSKTALFTSYVAGGFGPGDQKRLVDELASMKDRGVRALLSNADTEETRELYRKFAVHIVKVARPINSDPEKRGWVNEVIVTTWEKPGVYEGVA